MSTANIVRGNVAEKLTIVAEMERTVAGSEEVSSGSKKEMERQKELDYFPQRLVKLETTDVKFLSESKEEVPPEEQRWSPSLDKNDPPRLPNIKAEQEEPWTSQDGEQLQGIEEVDIIKFTFTPVNVKSEENDEEEPQSSQLYDNEKMKSETDGQDCGGPEPTRSFGLDTYLEPVTDDETSHSSESDTDDSCDWQGTSEPQPGFNYLRNNEDPELNAGETPVSSSKSASRSCRKRHLHKHSGIQTEVKTFSCSVCGKNYISKNSLTAHTRLHSEGKSFSCSVCKKSFPYKSHVVMHMRVHTGEKPFSCSICSTSFKLKGSLKEHMRVHSGEKPFRCTVCDTSFTRRESLTEHIRIHTGEKPFRCLKCGRRFGQSGNLRRHMRIHGEEKPFRCPKCGRKFRHSGNMRRHMRIHIVETI